jgi:hypothetical protein
LAINVSKASTIHDVWRPQTRQEQADVLRELQEILASPHFCNSKRYPALLQYIVEKTLAGESESLKERTLGVEVFDRPPSYDTNADTVVRYTAGEVRKRLSLYYHELGHKPLIQISLPAGSYIPEFFRSHNEEEDSAVVHASDPTGLRDSSDLTRSQDVVSPRLLSDLATRAMVVPETRRSSSFVGARQHAARAVWWSLAVFAVLLAGGAWKYRAAHQKTPVDSFWAPVLQNQSTMMLCIGGSVFSQTHASGVATATKDVDYPFISLQSVSAVAQISALLERNGGVTTQLQSAATTPLTELREHPVIMLGGYNNPWTLRLLQPLRFHFASVTQGEWIVDSSHPEVHWERDASVPYSDADDYAIVARFHDSTTDSWVVALAGVGRNGTEAAAHFATSLHYMQLLRDQAGTDFSNRNVEAVLKVKVIDSKTGAPTLLAVNVW